MKKITYTLFAMGLIYVILESLIILLKKAEYQDKVYLTLGVILLLVSGMLYLYEKKRRQGGL